jgi:drug/metabolite transporter (DMT)-like permease
MDKPLLPKTSIYTNRRKAVVFANLYMAFHFCYFVCAKKAMYDYNVNGVDLCLVRTCVVGMFNLAQIKKQGIGINVPHEMRTLMLVRNVAGLLGFTALVYALKNLPMGIFMILNNTAPFIASALSYLMLGERMRWFELLAMCLSFAAVVVLATGRADV